MRGTIRWLAGCLSVAIIIVGWTWGHASDAPRAGTVVGLKADLEKLREPSGLWSHGDVDTTFLALQLAPDLLVPQSPRIAKAMRDKLRRHTALDAATRMKALAILRNAGGDSTMYAAEIRQAIARLRTSPVTEATLEPTISIIDALRLLDPEVPQVTLRVFPLTTAASRQHARAALASIDMFANASEIRRDFRSLRPALLHDVMNQKVPQVLYESLNAIVGLGQASNLDRVRIANDLHRLQGCSRGGIAYPSLFRESAASRESCSLSATWLVLKSGFAFDTAS